MLGLTMELLHTLTIRTNERLKTSLLKHQIPKNVLVLNYTDTKAFLLPIKGDITLFSPQYSRKGGSCLKFSPSLFEYSNT